VFATIQPRLSDAHQEWRNHLSSNSFRITTCKSACKQRTLTTFRINTYEKHGGRGPTAAHRFSSTHSFRHVSRHIDENAVTLRPLHSAFTNAVTRKAFVVCIYKNTEGVPHCLPFWNRNSHSSRDILRATRRSGPKGE
jgi:hypothetical protein